jgi:hypothetical protein
MPRRIRQWWRVVIAAAAIMSPHAAAADQPVQTVTGPEAHDQADAPPNAKSVSLSPIAALPT